MVATVFGRKFDYPISPSNGCLSLTNAECPLDKGEVVTYRLSLPIQSTYPEVRADFWWDQLLYLVRLIPSACACDFQISLPIQVSLVEEKENTILACFGVTVSVTSPADTT